MQKTITMALSEYQSLIDEYSRMKEILNSKDLIGFEFKFDHIGMGHYRQSWNVITKDELIIKLIEGYKEVEKKNSVLLNETYSLENKIRELKEVKVRSWF
jgi:hypothetical protein